MQHEKMEQFLRFTEGQPPSRKYDYDHSDVCAIAQWYQSMGREYTHDTVPIGGEKSLEDIAIVKPHTFGALSKRLRQKLEA